MLQTTTLNILSTGTTSLVRARCYIIMFFISSLNNSPERNNAIIPILWNIKINHASNPKPLVTQPVHWNFKSTESPVQHVTQWPKDTCFVLISVRIFFIFIRWKKDNSQERAERVSILAGPNEYSVEHPWLGLVSLFNILGNRIGATLIESLNSVAGAHLSLSALPYIISFYFLHSRWLFPYFLGEEPVWV